MLLTFEYDLKYWNKNIHNVELKRPIRVFSKQKNQQIVAVYLFIYTVTSRIARFQYRAQDHIKYFDFSLKKIIC